MSPDIENPAYTTCEDGACDTLYCIMMTCESNVKDQIRQTSVPSEVWKKLKNLYKPSSLSTQFGYLSTIWGISLDDYPLVTAYCSMLELAASNYFASGPTDFAHQLALVALMGLPPSYKMTQCNILSKAGTSALLLDSIKGDLLNKERLLVRETKIANTMHAQRQDKPDRNSQRGKPRTPEEKAHYADWLKTATCRNCKEVGHIEQSCPRKTATGRNQVNQATSKNASDDDSSTLNGEVFMATLMPTSFIASDASPRQSAWVMDSGCSHHMTPTL